MKITFSNYEKELYAGAMLAYGDRVGRVEADPNWVGGFKIDGRSICHILEEYGEAYLLYAGC